MRLNDAKRLDANYREIVVLFNARPEAVTFSDASFSGKAYTLHPIQQNSVDEIVKSASFTGDTFNIPARTAAVFVIAESKTAAMTGTLVAILGAAIVIFGIAFLLRRKRKA